jgi:UDPglucose 6-dehydrogenase
VNKRRPEAVIRLAEKALGSLRGKTIAQLGLAFKPGTDDLRDSPAIPILKLLRKSGADVRVYDPVVTSFEEPTLGKVSLLRTPEEALDGVDGALIVTAWPQFSEWDWGSLSSRMKRPIIVDARNVLRHTRLPDHIVYRPIGRCLD